MKKKWLLFGSVFFMVLLFTVIVVSSGQKNIPRDGETGGRPELIVTTIYPVYYFTKEIAGDKISVERLIRPGENIHSFTPTPGNMVTLTKAKMFISLGSTIEPWANKLANATNVKLLQLDRVLTLRKSAVHHHDEEEGGDGHEEHDEHGHHSENDPHIWLSFENNRKMIEVITRELSTLYPQYAKNFEENAASLLVRLYKLDDLYSRTLHGCGKKMILVGHDAFGYLEEAYHFRTESIAGAYENAAPNAARIARLTDLIKEHDLRILFYEPLDANKNAKQLAEDMNLTLEPLYAIGNLSSSDEKEGKDFIDLLQFDLTQLKKGLECQ